MFSGLHQPPTARNTLDDGSDPQKSEQKEQGSSLEANPSDAFEAKVETDTHPNMASITTQESGAEDNQRGEKSSQVGPWEMINIEDAVLTETRPNKAIQPDEWSLVSSEEKLQEERVSPSYQGETIEDTIQAEAQPSRTNTATESSVVLSEDQQKDLEGRSSQDDPGDVIEGAVAAITQPDMTMIMAVPESSVASKKGKQRDESLTYVEDGLCEAIEGMTTSTRPVGTDESTASDENSSDSSRNGRRVGASCHQNATSAASLRLIRTDSREQIFSVVFTADEKNILVGGDAGEIRCWRIEDGKEVPGMMDAGTTVYDMVVSEDGNWVVSGAWGNNVRVFDAETREMVMDLEGHSAAVTAVDISPDGSMIASGANDWTVRVWSFSTGGELFELQHKQTVAAVKFSPNGLVFATATWFRESLRIYETATGSLLDDYNIEVGSGHNQSIVWHPDSTHLFVASQDGHIYHFDAFTGDILWRWRIHKNNHPECIILGGHDAYIAASAGQLVSFWDPLTYEQIGSPIEYTQTVECVAILGDHRMVAGVRNTITLRDLRNILPPHYCAEQDTSPSFRPVIDTVPSGN